MIYNTCLCSAEQKITKNVLQELSEIMIAELIPTIGPRAIFLSYWRKTCKENPLRSIQNDDSPTHKRSVSLYSYLTYTCYLFIFKTLLCSKHYFYIIIEN